jgi:hypothetical protein
MRPFVFSVHKLPYRYRPQDMYIRAVESVEYIVMTRSSYFPTTSLFPLNISCKICFGVDACTKQSIPRIQKGDKFCGAPYDERAERVARVRYVSAQ